jgi:hypothetical protein
MSHRLLVKSFLASARAASVTQAGRLAWLETRRAELSAEVEGGDWEVGSSAFDGHSASARRHASAAARLEAVMEAIEILTLDPTATRKTGGGVLIPRFTRIPHA